MPEMDGHRVLLEVRSHPSLNHVPFIFLTARASREDVREGMDLGADDYITKPFTFDEILGAIKSRLDKQAVQDTLVQSHLNLLNTELEQEREKRLLKLRLVATFSHDFRNPLAAILSSVGLIRAYDERLAPERRREHLDRMEGSVRLLLQMLDNMLLVAQMESGQLQYEPQGLDVTALTAVIVSEFALIYNTTHKLCFESSVQGPLDTDPRLLRQIVANLVSNAVKYSPSGGEVNVTLTEYAAGVELVVHDQGIGFLTWRCLISLSLSTARRMRKRSKAWDLDFPLSNKQSRSATAASAWRVKSVKVHASSCNSLAPVKKGG